MTTRIFLVRHGETTFNVVGRLGGSSQTKENVLSSLGKKQVRLLASHLARLGVGAIYSSPLPRALETAKIISRRVRKPIVLDDSFREVGVGVLEGVAFEEVEKRFPRNFDRMCANPWRSSVAGAEPLIRVQYRLLSSFRKIVSSHHNQNVVIVAHNLANRVLLSSLLGISLQNIRILKQYNACLNILTFGKDGFRIHLINGPHDPSGFRFEPPKKHEKG